jgi:CIC family chloride channel protein
VLDAEGRFLGAISLHDLAPLLRDPAAAGRWPAELLREDYPRVHDTTPSWQVLETFATHAGERLPVLDADDRLLGHVTKTDLVLMFRERLAASPAP